jgi:hypothetical protein
LSKKRKEKKRKDKRGADIPHCFCASLSCLFGVLSCRCLCQVFLLAMLLVWSRSHPCNPRSLD